MAQSFASYEDVREVMYTMDATLRTSITQANLDDFIAANFTGGAHEPTVDNCEDIKHLSIGIYSPVKGTKSLRQLIINKILLLDAQENRDSSNFTPELNVIAYRTVLAWQKMLPEPVNELKALLEQISTRLTDTTMTPNEKTLFFLEQAQANLIYYEHDAAEQCITTALNSCGIENVELAGKMGKRTRFQQKELSQLILTMEVSNQEVSEPDLDVPTSVALNDDTILETVALSNKEESPKNFSSEQLAVILAQCRMVRRMEPKDDLLVEKCGAYLSLITSVRRCWAVQCAALIMRADLERCSKRRVERACSQLELIIKLMEGIDDETPVNERRKRAHFVLAAGLEPVWSAKVIHAEVLRSLGVTSEALLIFEQLELWDHVIDCFKSMNQLEKANHLIQELLKTRPNDSMLYVYLGDINQNESYYKKAIEISCDKNAKAHKALGHMLLMRNQYGEAWKHLKRSVELQPVQFGVWFNAGHCAWKLEEYSKAISCYHRCVCLEPDHFEAWNNLSAAYIRLGEKERAKLTIQESLKFNYEHAKVWENYLLVCVDTGDFGQAIHAFHRLLDLNKRQQDDEVLGILAEEILKRYDDASLSEEEKQDLVKLKKDLITLFARITVQQTLSTKVWILYAKLKKPNDNNITEYETYVNLLERALLSLTNTPDWSKDEAKCESALQLAVEISHERFTLGQTKGTEEASKQAKARVRMSLRTLITSIEKRYPTSVPEQVKEGLEKANAILASVS